MKEYFWAFLRFAIPLSLGLSCVITAAIYFGFTPYNPAPKSPEISVQSISLSGFSNLTTYSYNVRLQISNPNPHNFIYYEDFLVNIKLFSRDGKTSLPFSETVPAFYQAPGNTTSLDFSIEDEVEEGGILKIGDGERERSEYGGEYTNFRFRAMGLVSTSDGCCCCKCLEAYLNVFCEGFYEAARDGVFPGGPKKCKAALSWF